MSGPDQLLVIVPPIHAACTKTGADQIESAHASPTVLPTLEATPRCSPELPSQSIPKLHSAYLEHLCPHLSSPMLQIRSLYSPSRKLSTTNTSGSLAGCGRLPIVSTLTSCVSLSYCILHSLLPVLLSDPLFDSLSPCMFLPLLFLLSTVTPRLDARLYPWYQDLCLVELLSAYQHIAPTQHRYLH